MTRLVILLLGVMLAGTGQWKTIIRPSYDRRVS